jgi:hypothetical protein
LACRSIPLGGKSAVSTASSPRVRAESAAAEAARYLEIPLGLVQAAVTYYGAYRDEIDQWIEANEQEAAEASAAWSAGQAAVRQ